MTKILATICCLFISSTALAQEYGALLGIHQTTPDSDAAGASVDGKMGFKAGLAVGFELMPMMRFRTGAIYNQRHFEVTTAGVKVDYNFDYLDVPIWAQYNFNDMIGAFGGLTVGVNINDDVDGPSGVTVADPDAEEMIPLLTVGGNFTFDNMLGFDLYYERGLGDIANNLKDYSTFGLNFIYWF